MSKIMGCDVDRNRRQKKPVKSYILSRAFGILDAEENRGAGGTDSHAYDPIRQPSQNRGAGGSCRGGREVETGENASLVLFGTQDEASIMRH
jgi:hypothetical protein